MLCKSLAGHAPPAGDPVRRFRWRQKPLLRHHNRHFIGWQRPKESARSGEDEARLEAHAVERLKKKPLGVEAKLAEVAGRDRERFLFE